MNFRSIYYHSVLIGGIIFYLTTYYTSTTPMTDISNADKWVHAIMFFGFTCALSLDHELIHGWKSISWKQLIIYASISGIYGGMIEIIQDRFFPFRSGDWMDWVADLTGCIIAIIFYKRCASPLFGRIAS